MLQADWTLPDSEIADYLASFGRFGIPFNILYYPDGQPPVIFDELLTKEKDGFSTGQAKLAGLFVSEKTSTLFSLNRHKARQRDVTRSRRANPSNYYPYQN